MNQESYEGYEARYLPYEAHQRLGPGRVLVFAPHPDDEVFGCGAAIRQHVIDGDPIQVVIATNGGFGRADESYVEQRREESVVAAAILGYGQPVFWDFPDRGLLDLGALDRRVMESVDAFRPEIVYAPSLWEVHPDHVGLALAVHRSLHRLKYRGMLMEYEVGVPLQPNIFLDATQHLEAKVKAMQIFQSQLEGRPYDQFILALNTYRAYTLPEEVRGAEAYRRYASFGSLGKAVQSRSLLVVDNPRAYREGGLVPKSLGRLRGVMRDLLRSDN